MTTAIFCSPKKDGETSYLFNLFISGREDVKTFYMYEENIKPCVGCGSCGKTGRCIYDDTNDILLSIEKSSHVIIASPVYNYSFPSPAKAFLDRLQPYYGSSPKIDKKGFLLVACGKSGKYSLEIMKKQTEYAFSVLGVKYSGGPFMTGTDKNKSLPKSEEKNVVKTADKFFKI